jgi:hypothetical protein
MSKQEPISKTLRIERTFPEGLQSHYVSNVVVQHDPDVFILSFFEVWPPVVLAESDEEKRKAFSALQSVDAKCVARLVIAPSKMKEVIATMQENFKSYEQLIQILEKEK